VPPMLFTIYLVWAVFFFLAARNLLAYVSFLNFTMWANRFHGLLMGVQAGMMITATGASGSPISRYRRSCTSWHPRVAGINDRRRSQAPG
jgi:hypothetical protein